MPVGGEETLETYRNFTDLRRAEYQQYLKDNNLQDNDESKAAFVDDYHDAHPYGDPEYDRMKDDMRFSTRTYNFTANERHKEVLDTYIDMEREQYDQYRADNGYEDKPVIRMKYYQAALDSVDEDGDGGEKQREFHDKIAEVTRRINDKNKK